MLENNLGKIKLIKLKKAIYPTITFAYILIVLVLFIVSSKFLTKKINQTLSLDEKTLEEQLTKIDLANYYLVADKLNLKIE